MEKVVQPHIPGLARADKKARPPKRLEKALQEQTRRTLGMLGYGSMETGNGRKQVCCEKCNHRFYPKGWQGNTPGFPDLTIFSYNPKFPALGFLVEMKGEDTVITKEQQDLADLGRSVIAFSIGDAVRAVLAAEIAMDAYRLSDSKREQIERLLEVSGDQLW